MRFEEVTERMGAKVNRSGHPDDGKPLNVAIPSLGNVRIWQAIYGGYTWAIYHEAGLPHWSDEEKRRAIGYSATYRRIDHRSSAQTIRIDGGPWDSFTKAEEACERIWKQIRRAQ